MPMKRADHLADEIKVEISSILLRNTKDPRIGFITITRVKVNDSLKNADIYFTKMGTDEDRKKAFEGLFHAKSFFRWELANRLRIKSMPALRFYIDDEFERVERINALFADINLKQRGEGGEKGE